MKFMILILLLLAIKAIFDFFENRKMKKQFVENYFKVMDAQAKIIKIQKGNLGNRNRYS
jgi:hypothetical protein